MGQVPAFMRLLGHIALAGAVVLAASAAVDAGGPQSLIVTVGGQAVTFPTATPLTGSLGGPGGATTYDLEAGQAGGTNADLTLGQDGSGNPTLSGELEAVPQSGTLAATPTASTVSVTPGTTLLVSDHAGRFAFVVVQQAGSQGVAFDYVLQSAVAMVGAGESQAPPTAASAPSGAGVLQLVIGSTTAQENGQPVAMDVAAEIVGGRTMVPLRFLADFLGAQVAWDPVPREVTYTAGTSQINLWIDNAQAQVNGQAVALDVPPTIVSGRTLVPVRFISQELGAQVSWDASTQTVTVTTGG
ncbi:MAG TPA: copper amine oxidase N-terminal domain-containing protein [Bacillota bacterium]|nr:copper amine oxidase N-terminal domain-containing protein [Bacillota bacterium]